MVFLKKTLYPLLFVLLILTVFNLSSFNLPTDKSRFHQSQLYFSETESQFGLATYEQNDIGMGMTTFRNEVILLKETQPAYDLLISEIEKAEKNINIGIYIIHNDATGEQFKNILISKAQQGVEVRLLYDSWGSGLTPKSFFYDLRKHGVKVIAFNPLCSGLLQGRLDNRLHRKMIVIDGRVAFIGGANIGDEYLSKTKEHGYWKDMGIIVKGEGALSLQQVFLNDWLQYSHEKIMDYGFYPSNDVITNSTVKIIPGGPDSPLTEVVGPHTNLIASAQDQILIITPYLFPAAVVLEALYNAAARNVEVHLILPRQSDSKLAHILNHFYIKKLLQHGIKVSIYNRGFIHSKIMIVDHNLASVGSANLDKLSHSKNYEVISLLFDKELITELENDFLNDLKDSTTYLPAGN